MDSWHLQLFNKSILKQEKLHALLDGIGGSVKLQIQSDTLS